MTSNVRDVSERWPDADAAVAIGGPVVMADGGDGQSVRGTEQSATPEEIQEWEDEHDEPHPVFEVPHRPERESLDIVVERDYMTTFAHHSCREKDRETLAIDDSNDKLRCAECGRFCELAGGESA